MRASILTLVLLTAAGVALAPSAEAGPLNDFAEQCGDRCNFIECGDVGVACDHDGYVCEVYWSFVVHLGCFI